ncbi:MAG TPA: hypothetical protein DCO79_15755 [Spirochaeta sp.]|nr:hypothetical protein [Spirochaeta sp.]
MKTVIAVPPVHDFYFTPSRASALGPAVLQNILADFGITADIYNFPAMGRKPARLRLPDELDYLVPHLLPDEVGPVSFFTRYHRFGPAAPECALKLLQNKPDIVFISCFAWAYAEECICLAAEIKRLNPQIIIAAGGAGVTVNPGYFSESGLIDWVLPGRAEEVLPPFLDKSPVSSSPGFVMSETGVSEKKNLRFISSMLTRGCPKACRFCANHIVHGRGFRKAEIKDIKSGISSIPSGMNIHMNFEDDNLLYDADYFFEVLEIIRDRFPDAVFSAENGLDYTYIDRPSVNKLIELGFSSFNFSMASSSQSLLSKENRPSNSDKLDCAITAAAEQGINSTTYFICGLEDDNLSSTLDNILRLHELPTLTGISMFYPVPGLPGFPRKMMSSLTPRLCAGSSARPWNESLSTAQLITAFRLSRLSNLLKTTGKRIPGAGGRIFNRELTNKLISETARTGRLQTIAGKTVREVPLQDEELVSGFLAAVSID